MALLIQTLAGVAVLAAMHLLGERLRVLHGVPRSRWLSAAGGVSAAYVFVHLLPELAHAQSTLEEAVGDVIVFFDHHIYLVALAGLVTFYGLEHLAKTRSTGGAPETGENDAVFWIHIGSFALYNALVGYLLLRLGGEDGGAAVVLYTVAMALHFVVNDVALASHHRAAYRRRGRWVLAAAVVVGWLIGVVAEVPEPAVAVLVAFLAGGIILNVLKEELPEERESRFWAFLAGAAAYAALLLVL